jgi:hypothetical protein
MIEIKLGQLRDPNFTKAYGRLMNIQGLQAKTAYHIAKVGSLLESELKIANESFDKLVKEYAILENENGNSQWKVPDEKLAAWTKAATEFSETVTTVDKRKLLVDELAQAALTPVEFLALEPVLSGMEVLEGGQNG